MLFPKSKRPAKRKSTRNRKSLTTTKVKLPVKLVKPRRSNASRKRKRWRLLVSELCKKRLLTVRQKLTL